MKGILQGLSHLHLKALMHRDIKPANILIDDLDDFSTVRICDFGLAEKLTMDTYHQSDENCGTLIYQSPE